MSERIARSIMKKRKEDERQRDISMRVNAALGLLAQGGKLRVDREVAHAVLLGSPWFWGGISMCPVGKSVGAGVWELRLENKP